MSCEKGVNVFDQENNMYTKGVSLLGFGNEKYIC